MEMAERTAAGITGVDVNTTHQALTIEKEVVEEAVIDNGCINDVAAENATVRKAASSARNETTSNAASVMNHDVAQNALVVESLGHGKVEVTAMGVRGRAKRKPTKKRLPAPVELRKGVDTRESERAVALAMLSQQPTNRAETQKE